MQDKVLGEMKNVFRPEFLNRMDMIVVFRALGKSDVLHIVDLELERITNAAQGAGPGAGGHRARQGAAGG